jgi:outer membrane protein assembly factor BamB
VLADGLVVVGADSALVALDPGGGGVIWRRAVPGAVKHGPTVAGSVLVTQTVSGRVMAVDSDDGTSRWTRQVGEPLDRWCWGGPAAGATRVVVGAAGCLAALDIADGRECWLTTELADDDWMASPCTPAIAGDTVVVAYGGGRTALAALDLADGSVRWRLGAGSELSASWSSPVVVGDLVVVTTVPGWLRACRLESGEEAWRVPLDGSWSSAAPAADDTQVFVVSSAGTLTAHDLADGAVRWRVDLGPGSQARWPYRRGVGGHLAGPAVDDGLVYAAAASGRLVAIDAATGALDWEADAGAPVWAPPAVDGGILFVATGAGTVQAWKT